MLKENEVAVSDLVSGDSDSADSSPVGSHWVSLPRQEDSSCSSSDSPPPTPRLFSFFLRLIRTGAKIK